MSRANGGIWYGIGAYTAWGVFPLYWKLLHGVPVMQVISHRIVWSSVMLGLYLALSGQLPSLRAALHDPKVWKTYATASLLIAVNWVGFLWAVGAGYIVEASLGYFINPLLSVLLAVFVLGEKLRAGQWLAVALATSGVLYLTMTLGQVPWISLLLATTFAFYGLVKKRAPLGSVQGLALETTLLAPPALALLLWSEHTGAGVFLHSARSTTALLLLAGAVTTTPLLMFATAARRIPMLWIGILQYIAPTLQLAIGVLVYHEAFARDRALGFSLVWAALVAFALEGMHAHRSAPVMPPPE